MKCPKCGFNSFEYYDSCKKCSSDLIGFKQTYSITPMVLPIEAKELMVSELQSAESTPDQISDVAETHNDIFSFDLPEDTLSAQSQINDDPFNFDEPSPDQGTATKPVDDVFADLLESTSQVEDSPFGASQPVSPAPGAASSAPGEFDLESFSWDDTPVATTPDKKPEAADDFDSLFGDLTDNGSK